MPENGTHGLKADAIERVSLADTSPSSTNKSNPELGRYKAPTDSLNQTLVPLDLFLGAKSVRRRQVAHGIVVRTVIWLVMALE